MKNINNETNENTMEGEMSMSMTIVDSIMGSGKTSWAINKMKNDTKNNYIYITPYLSEVQRIKENCKEKRFTEPKNIGNGKLDSLHKLILDNRNIASTHALFKMSTEVTIELLKSNNYILILDEVMEVVQQVPLRLNDMDVLTSLNLITVDKETNVVSWNDEKKDFDSKYNDIKAMCKGNSVFMVNNALLMWTFPINIFKAFNKVYVLTFMFRGQIQKYYYDLYNINYEYKSTRLIDGEFKLVNYAAKDDLSAIKENINILQDIKLNSIGESEYALSKTWYVKAEPELLGQLKNNNVNFFINKTKGKSKDNMFCTFKDYQSKIKGSGYSRGHVSIGSRATNEFSHKINLAYNVNNFLNPVIKQFFISHNVNVDQDIYALSELLQWIWRSQIRNNKPINIYIPSSRMRQLLIDWLG